MTKIAKLLAQEKRIHECRMRELQQSDAYAAKILNELSDQEIAGAQKVMSSLVRGIQANQFRPRAELAHAIITCSLLLAAAFTAADPQSPMKRSKYREHPDFGTWKPVKLTHARRLDIYRALKSGVPKGEFAGVVPLPQLEAVWKEFAPGTPSPRPDNLPRGIRGNNWYCEMGCGAVLHSKQDGEVFLAVDRRRRKRYACAECLEAIKQAKAQQPA